MIDSAEILFRIQKSKLRLAHHEDFFGGLIRRIDVKIDPRKTSTMCVDKSLMISAHPGFVAPLDEGELNYVVLHEVLHVAFGHTEQKPRDEFDVMAMEYIVNSAVDECALVKRPKSGAFSEYSYHDYSWLTLGAHLRRKAQEENARPKNQNGQPDPNGENSPSPNSSAGQPKPDNPDSSGNAGGTEAPEESSNSGQSEPGENSPGDGPEKPGPDSPESGDPSEPGTGGEAESDEKPAGDFEDFARESICHDDSEDNLTNLEIRQIVQGSLKAALNRGTKPGKWAFLVESLLETKIRWQGLLGNFLTQRAETKNNWYRPNQKFRTTPFIFPTRENRKLNIGGAVDLSGSVPDEDVAEFFREFEEIISVFDAEVEIVLFDTKIQGAKTFTRADLPIKMKLIGRGGTDFVPVFDYFKDKPIDGLVFMTDLCGTFPKYTPHYDVLWVVKKMAWAGKPPFGDVIYF